MKLVYFAWVREKVGTSVEDVTPPDDVTDVSGLIDWLRQRGGYTDAFADLSMIRVAVNQSHVDFDHAVEAGDEVAFFPPITGG